MKTIALFILVIGTAVLMTTGCKKDYFPPVKLDSSIKVSFSQEIQPIFTSNCTNSGCHSGAISPNLTIDNAYDNLTGGGYVDTLKPESCKLYMKLRGNMPPSGHLPELQIQKILNWIKQGAQNN